MSTAAEDAESVDQFLARIASLKDRRDREDEERIRKVEEEILQGRKERQARRAERARSISPSKSSPAPSSFTIVEPRFMANRPIDPPVEFTSPSEAKTPTRSPRIEPAQSPRVSKELSDVPASRILHTAPPKGSSTSAPTPAIATSLARSGTLSWQQRPSSRDSNSNRPPFFSGSPVPSAATDAPKLEAEEGLSRSQIAKSLASKDPAFVRQTADRGVGSAAYRRNESENETNSSMNRGMRLPGMSREQSAEPEWSPSLDFAFTKPQLPVYNARTANSRTLDGPTSTAQSNTSTPVQSSPLSTPRLAPSEPVSSESKAMDASSAAFPAWGSSKRPPSPTKGLGGFVESAMMKRSDSVNKRWSVQAAPGLKRGDPVASNKTTLGASGGGPTQLNLSGSPPRQTRPIRPLSSSSPAGSRPTSSHDLSSSISKLSILPETLTSNSLTEPATTRPKTTIVSVDSLNTEDGKSFTPITSVEKVLDHTLPISPTKTMDSRRWSPTKSSWLESALARPESPKALPSRPEEPVWKSSMHKAKTSVGSPPAANFEVNPTSLLRSPPMGGHSRPLSISGLPESFSSGMVKASPEKSKPAVISEDSSLEAAKPGNMQKTDNASISDVRTASKTQNAENPQVKSLSEAGTMADSPAIVVKRDPPLVKAKPATPPKTDFRSALKPRQVASSGDGNAEPEFKSVFGKLKRTQTQNYVAPDELKDNITRGKASLNLTGGPQKAKRVDEFKESILLKKEAMKEGVGLTAKPSIREKPAPVVPEALAKKQAMKAGITLSAKPSVGEKPVSAVPEALAKRQLLGKSAGATSASKIIPVKPEAQPTTPAEIERQADLVSKPLLPSTKDKVEELSPLVDNSIVTQPQQMAGLHKQELANSKLASRLNPALAGFLSRGASPKTSANPSPAASTEDLSLMPRGLSRKATNESDEAGGAALTHMTKARARGPKRRAPKAEAPAEAAVEKRTQDVKPKSNLTTVSADETRREILPSNRPLPTPMKAKPTRSESLTPKPLAEIVEANKQPKQQKSVHREDVVEAKETPKEKPPLLAKSPELRKVSQPDPESTTVEAPASPVRDRMRAFNIAQDLSQSPAEKPLANTGGWNKPSVGSPVPAPLAPSTTKLNTPISPNPSNVQQKPPIAKSTKPVSGLGLNLAASSEKDRAYTATELTPPPEKPQPFSVRKTISTDDAVKSKSKSIGKLRGKSTAQSYFADFFEQAPRARDKSDFDTQTIMSANKDANKKIKTLSMSIWEITSNGKKEPMPAQQEHILFEDSMYLCVHSFQPESGSKVTEAHLWVGDAMAEAAVEDAQLFCRKIARENGAKLEVLQQGKETATFFQALGGIVITRRNKHSALYMLCGRRHLGHVAFDEVDLDATGLCSGFPYIVSAKFGKLFLWKGRGSGADELGCARLIGMDLGLTGEIEEINEGEEPKSFWESFSSKTRSKSSELWDLKATQDAYACRLYRVEMERPRTAVGFWGRRGSSPPKTSNKALVDEISPFCQGDLNPQHIYVLDAYFEIYVYVGDQAASKHTEFVTASMLAQEMSMLAPTLQDRPLMPVCHLVCGDPPKDFKATLRKWEEERHEKSLAFPLDEAIEALE